MPTVALSRLRAAQVTKNVVDIIMACVKKTKKYFTFDALELQ